MPIPEQKTNGHAELIHVQIEAIENLSNCVTELTSQIEVLRNVLDEIREDFAWAVQNGRLSAGQRTKAWPPPSGARGGTSRERSDRSHILPLYEVA